MAECVPLSNEERFQIALKNSPLSIFNCDLNLVYTWAFNPPLPLTAGDFLGNTDYEVFFPFEAAQLIELKKKALSTGLRQQATLVLSLYQEQHSYEFTVEPMRSTDNRIIGLTATCMDVTERVAAERLQEKAIEEAELANQAKTRFLSNMSHEIRTPLGVIEGFAELANDPQLDEIDRQEYLRTIKRNAENLTRLLGEILDLSKIEAGRLEIEKACFSLPLLMSEVVAAFSLQAREKGIAIKFDIDGAFPEFVCSDPLRVRQVLVNLLSNAVKFTSRGGVEIIGRYRHPAMVEFSIRDSGVGIKSEQQHRLFQPFMQADTSTTRKFGGSGLGLNLSKKLAELLGGDLCLQQSEFSRGSTFRFTFDCGEVDTSTFITSLEAETNADTMAALHFNDGLQGMKILLVEDSADNQRLFSRYLRPMGAEVDIAEDGLIGVELAQKQPYHLVLMDIQMPNLDGYEATAVLRADGFTKPIIALTAHAVKEEQQKALAQGFNGYLTKPLNPEILFKTLHQYWA